MKRALLALIALWPASAAAQQTVPDPGLVAAATAITELAPLPPIRMIGRRVYAELPATADAPARWAFAAMDDYLAKRPKWTIAIPLTAPAGETAWKLIAVHCLAPAQLRCLVQTGPGDGRTVLQEYDVAANRIVPEGFALPLGRHDVDWDDSNHVLIARRNADGSAAGEVLRWARGSAVDAASAWFKPEAGAANALWPSMVTDAIGSRMPLVIRERAPGRWQTWLRDSGVRLALPESAYVSGLVQGQAVIITGDEPWSAAAVPAHSVATLPLTALRSAQFKSRRIVFTAGVGQRLEATTVTRSALAVLYKDKARSRVDMFNWRKAGWRPVAAALPENSVFSFAAANDAHDFALLTEARYLGGERRWRIDPAQGARIIEGASAPEATVRRFSAKAADGTALPYFVVSARGARDDAPLLVTGSGAWGDVRGPAPLGRFEQLWVRQGGIVVDAVIRGGGEFGEDWHKAGSGPRRATSFADFRAIAEDLVARGLGREGKMGLFGSDAFALPALDAVTRQPGRWRAVWLNDPVADLEQAATLGVAESERAAYAAEFGGAADAAALADANPLRRLRSGATLPRILIMHARNDPWNRGEHSRALVAALTAAGARPQVEQIDKDYDAWWSAPERAALAMGFFRSAGLDPEARP